MTKPERAAVKVSWLTNAAMMNDPSSPIVEPSRTALWTETMPIAMARFLVRIIFASIFRSIALLKMQAEAMMQLKPKMENRRVGKWRGPCDPRAKPASMVTRLPTMNPGLVSMR